MSRGRSSTRCTGRCATSSTCRTSTPPTTTSSTATCGCCPRARGRWRRSPRSGSTTRWRGSRTTRRRARAHFQNHILFTNYQFYMDEFVEYALKALADPSSGYTALVEPGNAVITREGRTGAPTARAAADAGLPPDPAAALGDLDGQHRRRAVERQDDHRPYRGAAPARLADGRALRRACGTRSRSATTCWRTPTCARTTCSTTTCRSGCRSRRSPRCRWRWRTPSPR